MATISLTKAFSPAILRWSGTFIGDNVPENHSNTGADPIELYAPMRSHISKCATGRRWNGSMPAIRSLTPFAPEMRPNHGRMSQCSNLTAAIVPNRPDIPRGVASIRLPSVKGNRQSGMGKVASSKPYG